MKKIFLFFTLLISGCDSTGTNQIETTPTEINKPEVLSSPDYKLKIYDLGRNSGKWTLIELEYQDKKHIILRNYDSNNQSMIELKD